MRSLRLLPAVAVALAIVAGCGDEESEPAPAPAPAEESADQDEAREPGAPAEGEPAYTGLGTWWRKLPDKERLASAELFVEDHPNECDGVDPVDLERQAGIAFGYDFPDAAPTDQVMLETCALILDGG